MVKKRGLLGSEQTRLKTLVRVVSLNSGTLTGKTSEVADFVRRRRINVVFLHETSWKGCKAKEIGGAKLVYHGQEGKGAKLR